jgi:hypothetical protein
MTEHFNVRGARVGMLCGESEGGLRSYEKRRGVGPLVPWRMQGKLSPFAMAAWRLSRGRCAARSGVRQAS